MVESDVRERKMLESMTCPLPKGPVEQEPRAAIDVIFYLRFLELDDGLTSRKRERAKGLNAYQHLAEVEVEAIHDGVDLIYLFR